MQAPPQLLLTAPSGRLSAPVCSRSFVSSCICSLDRRRVSRTLGGRAPRSSAVLSHAFPSPFHKGGDWEEAQGCHSA